MRASSRQFAWPLLIAVLAAVLYGGIRVKRETLVDFEVYRTAAMRALSAEPLYRAEDGHYQFKYLPAFALTMAPFAGMPPKVASAVWFALSVGLFSLFILWSVRALPNRRLSQRALIWLAVLLTGKFWVKELMLGQTNILLGILLVSALREAQRDRWQRAAVFVGLGIFVKPYAIVLLPWLAIAGGLQTVLVSSAVLAFGLLLPAAVYGWDGNRDQLASWYHTVTATTAPNLLIPENISLAAMGVKWMGPGTAAQILTLATGAAAIALAGLVLLKRRRVSEPNYLEFGFLMLLVPLLSPQGWDYVLILATPAMLCLVDRWHETRPYWRSAEGTALFLVSFTIFDLMGRTLYSRLMAMSVVTVSALVLAASLAHLRWRSLA